MANGTDGPHYYGYCIELLDALAQEMDFDYDIYDSPDGLFGAMADDGSWNGVMNELINKVLVLCSQASLFSWLSFNVCTSHGHLSLGSCRCSHAGSENGPDVFPPC